MKFFMLLPIFCTLIGCKLNKNVEQENKSKIVSSITKKDNKTFSENLKELKIPEIFNLQEVVIGDENAKNTIIVYSSFTCKHCCKFHLNELQKIKKLLVNTKKAKIYLRNYIDDQGAFDAGLFTRVLGGDSSEKIEQITSHVFAQQEKWLDSKEPQVFLKNVFVSSGYKIEDINAALLDKTVPAGLMKAQQTAMHKFHITSVPAFVINNKVYQGILSSEEILEKINK